MENNKGLAIIITVASNTQTIYFYAKRLRFSRSLKVVDMYWNAGLGSVYPNYCSIRYDWLIKYRERLT